MIIQKVLTNKMYKMSAKLVETGDITAIATNDSCIELPFESFIQKVTDFVNNLEANNCEIISISYIDKETVVISYKDIDYIKVDSSLAKSTGKYFETITVKRKNNLNSTIGLEHYEVFQKRVMAISNLYNTFDIKYLDNETAIIKYYV